MKHTNKTLLILMLVAVVITACEKEEEIKSNHLSYNGVSYELDHGRLTYYGQWFDNPNSYNFDLSLHSSGLQYDDEQDELTGKGHGIFIELFSPSETELANGTYNFDANQTYDPNTFFDASFFIHFNTSTDIGDAVGDIVGGRVRVEKAEDVFEFDIDCQDEAGNSIKAYFKGSIVFKDMTEGDFKAMKRAEI